MRAYVDYARSLHSKTAFVALFENVREGRPFARIWSHLALGESGDSLLSKYKSLSLIQPMALLENLVDSINMHVVRHVTTMHELSLSLRLRQSACSRRKMTSQALQIVRKE